jgi:N-methylhydantoinase A
MRLGFDVGGTFTDFVLLTSNGQLFTGKRLTTYPDPSDACLAGLQEILERGGAHWSDLEQLIHGTTWGSNVIIERKGVGVGLVTTAGFRDVLAIAREKRYALYDLQIEKPEPLIGRSSIWEIRERTLADGSVATPLDEPSAREVVQQIRSAGIQSLAVCFLHSYRNATNERRFAEIVHDVAPEIAVSLSSEVSPQIREYERTSTTAVNAYVMTAVRAYLQRMLEEVRDTGYNGRLFIMQSNGGIATAETMTRLPVHMIESGPAGGAIVAALYGGLTNNTDVVAFDMGGTTAKLAMIKDGVPETVSQFELHKVDLQAGSGIPMSVRSIDLVEIGAGGGSIAEAGMGTIQVGPESAGSTPGPACYGRGGDHATVTDANVVLGYLSAANFAGGTMTLDAEAARDAVRRRVAGPLGISIEQAAWGIHRIANLNMELAARVVSIDRGYDPRDLALVATGGCGPAHACRMASALGMPTVIVPAAAGVASAIGMLAADMRFDVSRSLVGTLADVDLSALNQLFTELEAEASRTIRESGAAESPVLVREVELRYVGQGYELTIEVPTGELADAEMALLRQRFEKAYIARYGFSSGDQSIEATTWKVTAYGPTPEINLGRIARGAELPDDALRETRPAYFPEYEQYVDTPAYSHEALTSGVQIVGPAVIEERESTTVVPPAFRAVVDDFGTLIIRSES